MKLVYIISVTFLLLACAGDSKNSNKTETSPLADNSLVITDSDTLLNITISNTSQFEAFLEHPSNSDVFITQFSQAQRGVLSVDSSRQVLTYEPKGSLNYLATGEVYQEKITYSAKVNGKSISGQISLLVTGAERTDVCADLPKVEVDFSQLTDHPSQNVQEGYCIQLDASAFNNKKPSQWSTWTGENGGNASDALFAFIGRDKADVKFTFLPPNAGYYNFSWCPIDNSDCLGSARFNVTGDEVASPDVSLKLNSNVVINDDIHLATESTAAESGEGALLYRWVAIDATDSDNLKTVIDVVTYSPNINFSATPENSNISIMLITADSNFNLNSQGFDTSFAGGGSYSVPRGLFSTDRARVYVRDPEGNKPPVSKLNVIGETISHTISYDDLEANSLHKITLVAGQSLEFDGSSSMDIDGDNLVYSWVIYRPGIDIPEDAKTSSSLTYTPMAAVAEFGQTIEFCVNDGFPWNPLENPCHTIEISVVSP